MQHVPHVLRLRDLRVAALRKNKLTAVPADLPGLAKHCTTLDLSENAIVVRAGTAMLPS